MCDAWLWVSYVTYFVWIQAKNLHPSMLYPIPERSKPTQNSQENVNKNDPMMIQSPNQFIAVLPCRFTHHLYMTLWVILTGLQNANTLFQGPLHLHSWSILPILCSIWLNKFNMLCTCYPMFNVQGSHWNEWGKGIFVFITLWTVIFSFVQWRG